MERMKAEGTSENLEQRTPERQRLDELEKTGLYVFHGTPADVSDLEPRQAMDTKIGADDVPGIHASQHADYAIFMAVVAPLGHTHAGTISKDDGSFTLDFGAEKNVLDRLTDSIGGWVYVCDRRNFRQRRPAEWISNGPVHPTLKIRVTKRDLPENINTSWDPSVES